MQNTKLDTSTKQHKAITVQINVNTGMYIPFESMSQILRKARMCLIHIAHKLNNWHTMDQSQTSYIHPIASPPKQQQQQQTA